MKRMKRLLAVLMAVAMVMSMGMSVLGENETYTITISNAKSGETYKAYKVFDATVSEAETEAGASEPSYNVSYTIESSSKWYTAINAKGESSLFTFTQVGSSTTYTVSLKDPSTTDDALGSFFASLSISLEDGDVAKFDTASGNTLSLTLDAPGYYYITTTTGSAVSLTSATPTVTVTDKNETPSVDKTVSDDGNTYGETNTAGIGDTVYFKAVINNIKDATKLVFHDTMDEGLKFDGSTSVTVKYYSSTGVTAETLQNSDYTLTDIGLSDGCTFEITLTDYLTSASGLSGTSYFEITYTATVTSGAVIGSAGNDNEAKVSYGDASTSNVDKTTTYVYELYIYKYTGDLNGTYTALSGAEFQLTNSEGNVAYFDYDATNNIYTLVGWIDSSASLPEAPSGSTYTKTLTSDATNMIHIKGLDAGIEYTLTETAAPSGYNLLSSAVTVTINVEDTTHEVSTLTVSDGNTSSASSTKVGSQLVLAVLNNTGSTIPTTGGIGTTIFYIAGAILVIGASVILITRRRMANR